MIEDDFMCRECRQRKPRSLFSPRELLRKGKPRCRACNSERLRRYNEAHPESARRRRARYAAKQKARDTHDPKKIAARALDAERKLEAQRNPVNKIARERARKREKYRRYYARNRDRLRQQKREAGRRWRAANPIEARRYSRQWNQANAKRLRPAEWLRIARAVHATESKKGT